MDNPELIEIRKNIDARSQEAFQLSEKIFQLKWKVQRCEFGKYCNDLERENSRINAKGISETILKFNENIECIDELYENNVANLAYTQSEVNGFHKTIKELQGIKENLEQYLAEERNILSVLKKRNTAIKLKLEKQNEDIFHKLQLLKSQVDRYK